MHPRHQRRSLKLNKRVLRVFVHMKTIALVVSQNKNFFGFFRDDGKVCKANGDEFVDCARARS